MARFLALEWDNREARVAVASSRGSEIHLEHALSVPLAQPDGEEKSDASPEATGERIAAAMAAARIKLSEALVAVGRSQIELKQLTLPPVPDDELPDMVRLQAAREFHSLAEDWPLDFLPLSSTGQENRSVLAAAMSPELLGQFQQVCKAADVEATRLVLRPCAAASLFLRRPEATEQPVRMLVDLLNGEADLTVLVERDAVFLRTARLPVNVLTDPENCRPLLAEIRRTLAAAQNQLGGRKVEAIYVCGVKNEHSAVVARLEQELGLPTRLFDPLAGLQVDPSLSKNLPANFGSFTPLLGLLADELEKVPHGMDFLHPRKKVERPGQRNRYVAYGLALCGVVLLGVFLVQQRLSALDGEIARLTAELKAFEPVVKSSAEVEKSVAEIKKWSISDINWLDELHELSKEFPSAQDAMLTQLRFSHHTDGGLITLDGLVKEVSVGDQLQSRLRDERHSIDDKGWQQDYDLKTYGWQFKSEVLVRPVQQPDVPAKQAQNQPVSNVQVAEAAGK